jgi:uncharacterized iron-regulated membrane protein
MSSPHLEPLDRLVPAVAALGLPVPALVSPPSAPGQSWTARSDTQDRPLRTDLTLDAATGQVLSRTRFGDKPALDRAVDYGVAAHEGHLFGLANQLLNLAIALGLITLSVSGAVMWWRRKPENALGAPQGRAERPVAIGFIALVVVLSVLLPMLGASILMVLATEWLLLRRMPSARRWLGLRAVPA